MPNKIPNKTPNKTNDEIDPSKRLAGLSTPATTHPIPPTRRQWRMYTPSLAVKATTNEMPHSPAGNQRADANA
jgi:hypothetical protein